MVTNDDGFAAAGIDTLVEALRQVHGVTVTVVAPADDRTGTGGTATDGQLATAEGETASGFAATTVDGFPTDTVPNLNVPSCPAGEVRGLVEVASATAGDALAIANCQSTGEGYADDVTAFNNGFATLAEIPVEPAAPAT